IVAVPAAIPVATPAVTTATFGSLDDHAAEAVISCFDPSPNVAIALNFTLPEVPVVAFGGVTATLVIAAAGTGICAAAPCPSYVADTFAVPAASAVTSPPFTLATLSGDTLQVACAETSAVVPSE